MSSIEFDRVSKEFDEVEAVKELTLDIADGEFMIFVGPSGCGKTTALRMVAGLEDVSAGEIRLGEVPINGVDAADRDIAMVFQNYALYPHMSVASNLEFPLRMQRRPKAEIKARVREVAGLLGIEPLLSRKPRQLSGGQRQRVAMGRAIVRHPQAFLMDEPLSNLDAKLRVQLRAELINLHQTLGVTTIYVTHDQTEAMTLGQRVTVLNRGVVQQIGPPQELYDWPTNVFVASFIGSPAMNFVAGRLETGTVHCTKVDIPLPDGFDEQVAQHSGDVVVGLRPEAFRLEEEADHAPGVAIQGAVTIVERLGAESLVYFESEDFVTVDVGSEPVQPGVLCARLGGGTSCRPGDKIRLWIDPQATRLFEVESGSSLVGPSSVGMNRRSAV